MIPRFSDHAANERTYLAWLRTALAVIAFGFLIERFDLIIHTLGKSVGGLDPEHVNETGRNLGLTLIGIGLCIMGLATWRYVRIYNFLKAEVESNYEAKPTLALGSLLIVIGVVVLLYVAKLMFLAG